MNPPNRKTVALLQLRNFLFLVLIILLLAMTVGCTSRELRISLRKATNKITAYHYSRLEQVASHKLQAKPPDSPISKNNNQ